MSYQAEIINSNLIQGSLEVVIKYTDGDNAFNEVLSFDMVPEDIETQINNRSTQLDELVAFQGELQLGSLPAAMPPAEEKLPEDTPTTIYKTKLGELEVKQRLADLKVIPDSDLDPLRAEVKQAAINAGII